MSKDYFEQLTFPAVEKSLYDFALTKGLDYLSLLSSREVFPSDKALEDLSIFEEPLPLESSCAKDVLEQLNRWGSPATTAQSGGRYFGFVTGGVLPVAAASKILATFWDQVSSMEINSPIAARLEQVVESWVKDLFGLPQSTVAGFVSGSSVANISSMLAARYRLLNNQGWDVNEQGLNGAPRLRVVAGKHIHATAIKAIKIVGLGTSNIEWVDVDAQGRICVDKIPQLDNQTILLLQAGNVGSGSFDNFSAICKKARQSGAWVHIDGAFGLWAKASKVHCHLMDGFEYASSWAVDAHKTLNVPYDSAIVMCEDGEALQMALSMQGSYIIKGEKRDGMMYTLEMSRRARIIELWTTIKFLGVKGINALVSRLHNRAKQFAQEISKIDGFEVLNDVVFNQVLVACNTDEETEKVLALIQESRQCWAGGSQWFGRRAIRISVCSWATTEDDILISVASFAKAIKQIK